MLRIRSPRCDDANLSPSQLLEPSKYFKIVLSSREKWFPGTNLKKTVLSKSGRSGALLGLNFRFFTSLWQSEGSRRPNRAAVTPIRQQNPPGPLKLLGLGAKTGKNTDFLILLKKTDFLVAHFVISWLRSFARDGRLRCLRLESPSDPPPQNYGTWCPGGSDLLV